MNIFKYEFYKVISKKMLWVLLTALLVLNGFIYINGESSNKIPLSKEYKTLEKHYSSVQATTALSKATRTSNELSILYNIISYKSLKMNDALIKEQITYLVQSSGYPISYDTLIKKYKGSKLMNDSQLLNDTSTSTYLIKDQLNYIVNYPTFINSMEQNAEQMQSVSIFGTPGTFAYRNIIRTPKDFSKLKGITLTLGDESGVVTATSFQATDLFVMALVFLVCVYLFLQEKEKGLIPLIKSNKNGRLPVILSKLLVLAIISILFAIIFYGSILILGNSIYGFGNTSRYVQSMSSFRDCCLLITVKQYLLLFISTKILVVVCSSMVVALFFTLLSEAKATYAALGIFLAVSYFAYVFIHPVSAINVFKYLNIFAFFNVFKLYTEYINLNLFGYAIQKIFSSLLVLFLVLALSISVNILAYLKLYMNSEGRLTAILNKLRFKPSKITGHTNLFLHETYKLIIGSKIYLIIIVSLILGYNTLNFNQLLMDYDSSVYTGYINAVAGKITPSKIAFINNEKAKFDTFSLQMNKLSQDYKKGQITEEEFGEKKNALVEFSGKVKGFKMLKNQEDYLLTLQKTKKISGSFINEMSSDYIFNNPDRDITTGLTYSVLLLLCLCSIFPKDYENDMISILRTTSKGRLPAFFTKYALGFILAVFLMIIIYCPYYINLLTRYGIEDWSAPIQSIQIFQNINIHISILGFLILANCLQLIGVITLTGFILFISQFVKKQSFSILIGTILFVVPFLIRLMGISTLNFFSLSNSFTLFNSFAEVNGSTYNVVYFSALILIGVVCFVLGAYKYAD
jgi:hypothetical protein